MSLTTQLHRGELGRWCAATFPGTPEVARQIAAAAKSAGKALVRPTGRPDRRHWADIGGAFGQRLADLVDPSPPYGALLGMIRAGWLSFAQAHAEAAAYPSHQELDVEHRARALSLRRTPDGWLDLGRTGDVRGVDQSASVALRDLLARTRAYQATHAPVGLFGSNGAEAGLARSAWVISACEGIYRSGEVDERLAGALRTGGRAEDLRALPSEQAVTELVKLTWRVRHTALNEFRHLAGNPGPGVSLGVAAPTFVPNWADGDLLVGTSTETLLVDVKTVMSLADLDRVSRWLWQILLYAWLDTNDLNHVRAVGLYLARHGVLVTWGLDELAGLLLGDTSGKHRKRTRREFEALAAKVITAEGARFPIS
ncbi:hypothetical protein BBK82_29930 [Lentzea guizhouensis]|uniref:Uncharacterized protein n=1 Tax=Lentzea guizhouensis TaxID=1586287 RepID=A0A1B2HPH0_9PSEU|nr:hypothetical protein [Lentzea guizhouensis]ANZ39637.1 hypothetical protein BBK82_29930 [Lentzea guizhouensis]